MNDLDHARMMLVMARKDLKAIEGMEDVETFSDEIFGFHAQQAVEKALKAWLSLVGIAYPKIHDLEELFALLEEHGQTVPEQFHFLVISPISRFSSGMRLSRISMTSWIGLR